MIQSRWELQNTIIENLLKKIHENSYTDKDVSVLTACALLDIANEVSSVAGHLAYLESLSHLGHLQNMGGGEYEGFREIANALGTEGESLGDIIKEALSKIKPA